MATSFAIDDTINEDIGDSKKSTSPRLSSEADIPDMSVCGPCLNEDNKRKEALVFCLECSENLCAFCKKQHHRLKITRNHSLVEIGMQSSPTATESCSEHPGRPIEYFCEDHRCLCCKSCFNMSHSHCRDTKLIAEAGKGIKESNELQHGRDTLDSLIRRFQELKSFKRRQNTHATRQKNEALKIVAIQKENGRNMLEKCAENSTKEIVNECDSVLESLATDEDTYETIVETLEATRADLQNVLRATGDSQVFINLKKAYSTVQKYSDYVKEIDMNLNEVSINFVVEESFQNLTNSMKSFGKLEVDSNLTNLAKRTRRASSISLKKKKAIPVGGHAVRISSDRTTCNITGAAFLADGRLVLADYNNRCLKLFDQKCKFVSHHELPSRPQDIAILAETEIATSLLDECAIQCFYVNEHLQIGRRVRTECQYVGLTCYPKSRHMFGTCFYKDGNGEIHILDMSGQILRAIGGAANGAAVLVRPTSIQVSHNGNLLFVSDLGQNSIICFDINTAANMFRPLFVYTDRNLELRNGLALDHDGNVYVCSGNMSIHQVTFNGTKLQEILTTKDGLGQPNCLCFNQKTEKLLVAEFKENSVKLFKLI